MNCSNVTPVLRHSFKIWGKNIGEKCNFTVYFQVLFNAGPRQRRIAHHDRPAGGDGVRHRRPETAAVRPDRQKPGEQKPS